MINKNLIDGLKVYKTRDDNIDTISKIFPMMFGNLLTMMVVKFPNGTVMNMVFDRDKLDSFFENFRNAIYYNEFDYIDNVILDFLHGYNFKSPPYMVTIDFSDEEIINFTNTCNNFKEKHWNDILDDLVDAIYNLLCSATANNTPITLGH